jgi:inosine-uridine nucleoside N-ribohydrolase
VVGLRALATVSLVAASGLLFTACSDSTQAQPLEPPIVLLSTDVAIGLVDTHGAQGSCPVPFDSSWPYARDTDVSPQDFDDGLTLAMALNLEAQGDVVVDAVVPIFGNATVPAEMLVARQIVRNLKGREDIPIEPGAMGPASQTLQPAPVWFDGSVVPIEGPEGSFAAACRNRGVDLMRERLLASSRPVTILAIGPMTDVACLLNVFPDVAGRIAEIVVLASRVEGESLTINGKIVDDFNPREDPLAATLFLAAKTPTPVPIRLMTFQLTGQTSQADDLIFFDASTLRGPTPSTPASERSLAWVLAALEPRNAFWSSIFGTEEGPFDQYTLAATLWPHLFACDDALAYVLQCPFPAWSSAYPTDAAGDPTEIPFNAPANPCVDHGPGSSSLAQVPAQIVVTFDLADTGPLVRGTTGIDGNLPALDAKARPVTACTGFASQSARQEFQNLLYANTW